MVAVLDQCDDDVSAGEALGEIQARLPGDGVVEHPVQQPHRAGKRNLIPHYEMTAAVFEQRERVGVAMRVVFGGQGERTRL